jgi:hypothetical protein
MKKPAIPTTLSIQDASVATILRPMKETLEIITGIREGAISQLPTDASLTDAVAKINEIITRLNFNE